MTAIPTGMREGELLGLQSGDIDWYNCGQYKTLPRHLRPLDEDRKP